MSTRTLENQQAIFEAEHKALYEGIHVSYEKKYGQYVNEEIARHFKLWQAGYTVGQSKPLERK